LGLGLNIVSGGFLALLFLPLFLSYLDYFLLFLPKENGVGGFLFL